VLGVFVGSSPCEEAIQRLLRIPVHTNSDTIRWKLTLYENGKGHGPEGYELSCEYGPALANTAGALGAGQRLERRGKWKISKGAKQNPSTVVYELGDAVSLCKVNENLLHILNSDRSLMVGNSGRSYTLNRAEASEKPGVLDSTSASPVSYTIAPPAKGPSVFGVFEGRTPCEGIAQVLKLSVHGTKAKWLVTLYQNPETRSPTTYRVEGTLFRKNVREGKWSVLRGTETDPNAIIYELAATETEPPLLLLKGDDNVLFFLNQSRVPLVGHADFSYTLNRYTEL
jgi:hypothetical protein